MNNPYAIIFLCTGNSCRSQMAEGFAKHIAEKSPALPMQISSAGIQSHTLNPLAVQVMAEVGVDISMQYSKVLQDTSLNGADLVVTLCGNADENWPVLPSGVERMHWPLVDPALATGSLKDKLRAFRASRDEIRDRVTELITQLQLRHLPDIKSFGSEDVRVLLRESPYRGFFEMQKLTLQHRLFAGGWSPELVRELFVRGPAVAVLPFDPTTQELALVEQFRIGALDEAGGAWLLELVAGMVDADEHPETVARRECHEEMGVEPYTLIPMFDYLVSPGGTNEKMHLYLGLTGLDGVGGLHGLPDAGEDIRVTRLSLALAVAAMEAGRINNAATIMAIQWLLLNKEKAGVEV